MRYKLPQKVVFVPPKNDRKKEIIGRPARVAKQRIDLQTDAL